MPVRLSGLRQGQIGIVTSIEGGHEFVHRLAEMGVCSGTELRAVRGSGPMIVEVKGHRLMIGRGMVDRILVEMKE
jgi:ferrous iron transport protein A